MQPRYKVERELRKHLLELYCNYTERCIATDGDYSDAEMVQILSDTLKRQYEFVTDLLRPNNL